MAVRAGAALPSRRRDTVHAVLYGTIRDICTWCYSAHLTAEILTLSIASAYCLDMDAARASKDAGNDFFKSGDYASAIGNYTSGIEACKKQHAAASSSSSSSSSGHGNSEDNGFVVDMLSSLYCNRAACYIKVANYEACIRDCKGALDISPGCLKALYRLALAHCEMGDSKGAVKSLSELLHIDPKNKEASILMIKVKEQAIKDRGDINSEVSSILAFLKDAHSNGSKAISPANLHQHLKGLVALLYDDKHHSTEFARKDGVGILSNLFLSPSLDTSGGEGEGSDLVLRVISCAASHKEFASFIYISDTNTSMTGEVGGITDVDDSGFAYRRKTGEGSSSSLLSFGGVCRLLLRPGLSSVCQKHVILLVTTIVRSLPPYRVVTSQDVGNNDKVVLINCLQDFDMRQMFAGFLHAMASSSTVAAGGPALVVFILCVDGIAAMLSEHEDYFTPSVPVDTRMEGLEDRRKRLAIHTYVRERCRRNAALLVDMGLLRLLATCLEGSTSPQSHSTAVRRRAVECMGRVIKGIDDDERMKSVLASYVPVLNKEQLATVDAATVSAICRRAEITAAVCATRPELGVWLFEQPGGCDHIIFMATRGDVYCQEVTMIPQ